MTSEEHRAAVADPMLHSAGSGRQQCKEALAGISGHEDGMNSQVH